jgi:ketosteroid isomerase-like protein
MLMAGCTQQAPDPKAAEAAVRTADLQWSKAAQARDVNTVLSYYSDDAVVMPPNAPMAMDRPTMVKTWTALLGPGADVSWTPGTVVAANSGDVVYDLGTYTSMTKVAKGKTTTDSGKYLAIWKKQPNGSWKAVTDTWNSDLPAVAAAPVAKKKG